MGSRLASRTAVAVIAAVTVALALPAMAPAGGREGKRLSKIDRFVVIYQENHSFDNLYGSWEGVDGPGGADAAHTTQVDQAGAPYACLPQNELNIAPSSTSRRRARRTHRS
jgi:phospholipase C